MSFITGTADYSYITSRDSFWVEFKLSTKGHPTYEYHLFWKEEEGFGDDWEAWAEEMCEQICADWHNNDYKRISVRPLETLPEGILPNKRESVLRRIEALNKLLEVMDRTQ